VNLFFHRQEELVARSEKELLRYGNIMEEPLPQRLDSLREWYKSCTKTAEKEIGGAGNSVKQLALDSLCETIKSAESVLFLGGASLGILQRFIDKGVADKVKCHLQVVSTSRVVSPKLLLISVYREHATWPSTYSLTSSTSP
jgi:hypothetical protein